MNKYSLANVRHVKLSLVQYGALLCHKVHYCAIKCDMVHKLFFAVKEFVKIKVFKLEVAICDFKLMCEKGII